MQFVKLPLTRGKPVEYIPFLRFTTGNMQMAVAVSAMMLVAALLCLMYGWRLYRILLVVTSGLTAGYIGWYFLHGIVTPVVALVVPLFIGLLASLAAIPVQRVVVFLVGGTVGFLSIGPVAAELIWRPPDGPSPTHYLLCGAAAFVLMGIVAIILFRPAITVATSMFGAALLVSACVHLLETFSERHRNVYGTYPDELAWAFALITAFGIVFQFAVLRKQKNSD